MKNILVPVDFSDITRTVVEKAAEIGGPAGAKITLINVVRSDADVFAYMGEGGFVGPHLDPEALQRTLKTTREHLNELAESLEISGVKCEVVVREGLPTPTIMDEAKLSEADMIVIGSHGHGALYHLLLGGVAESIIRNAPCPVMVVHSANVAHKAEQPEDLAASA